ncbi:MAG: hypothetical protein COB96_03615 [Planctomycetota bacterium]|jgi:hypothetical protein|nr:MAG: hypothetical protein COB96_03615 [Planctomycetota bacterium]
MKLTLLSCLAIFLGMIAIQDAPATELARTGSVVGVVMLADHTPVAGAVVRITRGSRHLETQSDRNGQFGFRRVPQGRSVISASDGRHGTRQLIGVRAGDVTRVRLVIR